MDIRERQSKGKQNCAVLWYDRPASDWNEALPVGNGRIGGMVFGDIGREQIQVNEDTVWYGGPMDRNNPSAKEKLPKIRELIMAGKIHEAERLCKQALSGTPFGMRIYQTLGDISIGYEFDRNVSMEEVREYERGLNVEEALCYTHFKLDETVYDREIFMSAPDDVCVMHLTAVGKEKMRLEVMQSRHHIYEYSEKASQDSIVLGGNLGRDGLDYAMMCKVSTPDGKVEVIGESIIVSDAAEVCLYWSALTTYRLQVSSNDVLCGGLDESTAKKKALREALAEKLEKAASKGYDDLRRSHADDYKSYFDRMSLTFDMDTVNTARRTTDRCLAEIAGGGTDLSLEQLYFNFGRYLLISCSRPGTLPATLQGLWNKDMEAPWDAKFTININTEMNYWPAESCDLGDCHLPLFDLLKKMLPNGRKTAEIMYGCRGFVAHHNTDIWGDTAPQDLWIPGSFWVMGAAWLCTHIWTHYDHTGDEAFLREMFPVMREAAQFFLDFCIEHEIDGRTYLCTCPSVSPENTFILPDGEQGANSIGVTMDNQILRDLFSQCNMAAKVLGVADELDRQIAEACGRLIPTRTGSDGRILEWCEEYEEKEPGHRHISHLYGLHPSDQITKDGRTDAAEALGGRRRTYRLEPRVDHESLCKALGRGKGS